MTTEARSAPVRPALSDALLEAFRRDLGDAAVVIDPEVARAHAVDWTGRFRGTTPAVLRPADTVGVAAAIRRCRAEGLAVVPQGGNTGLVAGATPLGGEVVVSLTRLRTPPVVDAVAQQVTVAAGSTLAEVQAAARRAGLRYAVDLGARDTATIGGTIATNAGGVHVVRLGTTRRQLLGVEAVLGDGSVVEHLGGLVKDNTGYDLGQLLCGSEGTLGIVTAARLALLTRPDETAVALVGFDSVPSAVDAVGRARRELEGLEAIEILLGDGMALVCDTFLVRNPIAADAAAYLLIEVAGGRGGAVEQRLASHLAGESGVVDAVVGADESRRAALWSYRERLTEAVNRVGPPVKLDVTVPAGAMARALTELGAVVADVAPAARTWLFGHAGDGNLHVNVTGTSAASEHDVEDAVLRWVARAGGSISAEHGIGRAKRAWLHLARSENELTAFRAIKAALDPAGILNPGVLV